MRRLLLRVALLTAVYLTVLGSVDPWDILLGAAISVVVLLLFRGHASHRLALGPLDPWSLPRFVLFAGAVVWEITTGAWMVLGVVLHLRPLVRPGILEIPISSTTQAGLVASAFVITVAPGTYVLDIDRKKHVMLIHALDASDPEAVRAHFHQFYERYQRRLFP